MMVPPSSRLSSTTVEHLSKRLSLLTRPLRSRVCNWLLDGGGIMLLLVLVLVVAWLSWGPGMEVGSVESDMVLPYVATKALSRAGSELNKIKIRAVV